MKRIGLRIAGVVLMAPLALAFLAFMGLFVASLVAPFLIIGAANWGTELFERSKGD